MSRFVISDIHGCFKTLNALLERINFSDDDHLYVLGDVIDRGKNSKKVIDLLMKIKHTSVFKGNHEDMLIRILRGEADMSPIWYSNGGFATLKSFKTSSIHCIPERYINWFARMRYYEIVDNFILVHAGLNPFSNKPFNRTENNLTYMMWSRDYLINKKVLNGKKLVVGHTPESVPFIQKSVQTNRIAIDGGCVFPHLGFGKLVALNLDTLELTFHDNIEGK